MRTILVSVRAKPGSRRRGVEVAADGVLTVWVRENAVDGKANAALAEVLAEHFQVSKSAVELIRGQSGRQKTFRVTQK